MKKSELEKDFQEVNGVNFLAKQVDLSMASTKDLASALGSSKADSFVFLASFSGFAFVNQFLQLFDLTLDFPLIAC